ncbi:uncharacterized protein B0H18DRAFT_1009324 [Fomitopsis serialis]|uniref:uncharacterized protein n=1 Tax=Fomitopsis serialis TaxID=139415 RepID=UPI002008CE68|nr:uncharacterized protein B0H18DRAFT_1009324 [Neoantrodia serialis]KAH9925260.1 hypothetical protein B0H18DRAFT_1009324 [Neoantrodia serialis]
MPRRPAPTPLRLSQGPLPKRSEPKHTLPSLPRPVFHPPPRASQGPLPRERAQAYALKLEQADDSRARAPVAQPAYGLPTGAVSPTSSSWSSTSKRRGHSRQSSTSSLSSNSSFSSRSSRESSRRSSLDEENPNAVYGPWVKHGKGFALPFDPNTLIMPPRPAAINPLPVW